MNKLLAAIGIVAAVIIFFALTAKPVQGSEKIPVTLLIGNATFADEVNANSTAFDLIKKHAQINSTDSAYGAFINCINDVCNTKETYWMFYVNGTMASSGVSMYYITDNSTIEMRFESPKW